MTAVVLAHGGTAGAVAEAAFLLFPVVAFFVLSRWSKRKERAETENQATPETGTDTAP